MESFKRYATFRNFVQQLHTFLRNCPHPPFRPRTPPDTLDFINVPCRDS